MHPLLAHALDVAAVATILPESTALGLDRRTLGFLVSLHDIGKIARAFQAQVPEHWPAALGPLPDAIPRFAHDAMAEHLLLAEVADALDPVVATDRGGRRSWAGPIFQAIAGHHGRPAGLDRSPNSTELAAPDIAAARQFINVMRDVFRPAPLAWPGGDRATALLAWKLAGLVTLADWIGSRQDWFPYVGTAAVADPAGYFWNRAMPAATAAGQAAGLSHAAIAPFRGFRSLFPALETPTPVQNWAATVSLPDGPVLAVIEDRTGNGKTEAALLLAHRLMAAGRARGLFVALPTMATASAMFGRLAPAYDRLFASTARPSLVLAHGQAALDPRFRATIPDDPAAGDARSPDRGPSPSDPADEPAEAHCAAWLADDRRRALLGQVGVGTIDQALLSVLPVRHAVLRQHGLSGKVLVVDEAHAFDAYMNRELRALLQFHAALGGSAILLSATLPLGVRQGLADAFRDGLQRPAVSLAATAYPLATLAATESVTETACASVAPPRTVAVSRLPDVETAIARIAAAGRAGAAVVWVRNTVDDAIAAAAALRDCGLDPLLFHARFAMVDRLRIEREVLRRFGRDADPTSRPGVLVATQVVEQSLDLDFDLMCSDLAPMDLLIQRAGRLWRHHRRDGSRPVPGPDLLVLGPDPVADPPADWLPAVLPGTAAVYRDPALLWRTARTLFARGRFTAPDDMRALIEAAFDRDSPCAVPPALAPAANQAEGKAKSHTGVAGQNVLDVWKGYRREAGLWEPDTRTPTRLEERETVTLRLARRRAEAVVPYADDPDPRRAWALSEIRVARRRVAACPPPPDLEAAVATARANWNRWERESPLHLLAVLGEDGLIAVVAETATDPTIAVYDERLGLVLNAGS